MTRRYFIPLVVLFLILPGLFSASFGQRDTTKLNQEVEVVKAYRPSVSNAEKINLLPEIGDTTQFRPDLNYKIISHPITSGYQSSSMKASNLYQRDIIYPGIGKIRAGVGSYLTPFFDLYISNPNSQNGSIGLQLNHLSSQGTVQLKGGEAADAPFSYNHALLFASYVTNGSTISTSLSYQRDKYRFYGYPITFPANIATDNFIKYYNQDQLNQSGAFDLSVKSNASSDSDLKYDTGISLNYMNTTTLQVEKAIKINGSFSYNFGTVNGKLVASFDHFENENITANPDFLVLAKPKRSLIQFSPSIFFQSDYFYLEGGVNMYGTFDDLYGNSFKPYPKAKLAFHTEDNNLTLYAGMDGYLQNNCYSSIVRENRWINPTLDVRPTNQMSIFYGGIKGKIGTPMAFNIGVKYNKAGDQYFYVTRILNRSGKATPALEDLTFNNAFEVEYDNLNTLDFSGELSYSAANILLLISGHFYTYELGTLQKAPYRPDFTLNTVADYKISEKLSASGGFFLTGPRNVLLKYYISPVSSSLPPPPIYLKTDAMVALNLGAKYQLIKHLEFSCSVENLLNRQDEPWFGYTQQGILFKLGMSFSF